MRWEKEKRYLNPDAARRVDAKAAAKLDRVPPLIN